MSKKASTLNLEDKVWEEIDQYMQDNGLKSRNTALEWMLVERRTLIGMQKHCTMDPTDPPCQPKKEEITSKEDDLQVSKDDIFNIFGTIRRG